MATGVAQRKPGKTGPRIPRSSAAYDANNNITTITKDNGAKEVYGYDAKGNLTLAKTTTSGGTGALEWTYEYQATYNLMTKATDPNSVQTTYAYDGNGNLITTVVDGGTVNLISVFYYDANNHYLLDWSKRPKGIRPATPTPGATTSRRSRRTRMAVV